MSGQNTNNPGKYKRLSDGEFSALKDEIKARVNLADVIGRHGVKLKREGRELVGLSPFTNEKTPSFKVNEAGRFYHCFSSGTHGDIFSWLMFSQNMTFGQAIEEGRRLAGIAEGPLSQKQVEKRKRDNTRRAESRASYQKRMLDYARSLWQRSRPAEATVVETYLRGGVEQRGLKPIIWGRHIDLDLIGGIPAAIRFHPNIRNKSGEFFPAMVCKITGRFGEFTGLHVTFLRTDGKGKIDTSVLNTSVFGPSGKKRADKMILGAYFGGAGRLITPGGSVFAGGNGILSVGEGIESVLSAYQLYLENGDGAKEKIGLWWAALSLGNLTGAQARDKWGKPKFSLRRPALKFHKPGRLAGDPAPDITRPGFLMPEGWSGIVRTLCEDDLKDDHKRGISGTERARRAYALAAAKHRNFGASETRNAWPPKGQDFNDVLLDRARSAAGRQANIDADSRIGIPREFQGR